MSYTLRDHTADVAVEATGGRLGDLFAAVADGMAAAQCEDVPAAGGERQEVSVTAEGREALLFDYLDQLIYERDVEGVLPVDNQATVRAPGDETQAVAGESGRKSVEDPANTVEEPTANTGDDAPDGGGTPWHLDGSYRGVPLADVVARDLKAVTYSEMVVEERADGWFAYVVFDV